MESPHLVETTNPWGGHGFMDERRLGPLTDALNLTPANVDPSPPWDRHPFFRASLFDVGILKTTLLPSVGFHSGLAVVAYLAGHFTNRLETKDWLWPSAQVLNAWWSAVGRRVFVKDGIPFTTALSALNTGERLVLAGVTLWGGRLFTRILRRSLSRTGKSKDDPRYETQKKEHGFWNRALFSVYLPEALFQAAITLPFTAPFRRDAWGPGEGILSYPLAQSVAVGLFTAGFVLEALADWQLDKFKRREERGELTPQFKGTTMCREGVWGIVRHPNYLGDTLVHLSFPLMLYASNLLRPLELLGPLANYLFLRFVGGDKENEHSQARRYSSENVTKKIDFDRYRREENAFWPDKTKISNKWTWIVVGCGVAGAVVERLVRQVVS